MIREGFGRWLTRRFWRTRYADFDRYTAEVNWLRSPLVLRLYINPLISGHPERDWLDWLQKVHFPHPAERGLSLGCGTGQLERRAIEMKLCRRLDACDLSADAIAQAQARADTAGLSSRLHYFIADLNQLKLQPSTYDLLLCPMSLHHVRNLEHLFAQARRALRPQGLLALNEFVGPDQFQWSEKQLHHANQLLHRVPRRYRRNLDPHFWRRLREPYRRRVRRRPRWRMAMEDPSESVRSSEVLPVLEQAFEIIDRKDYGGTLLQLVLDRIAGNFHDTEEDRRALQELCDYEQKLIRQGELSSDFTAIVARPRAESPGRR